jgi:hypothetical protein
MRGAVRLKVALIKFRVAPGIVASCWIKLKLHKSRAKPTRVTTPIHTPARKAWIATTPSSLLLLFIHQSFRASGMYSSVYIHTYGSMPRPTKTMSTGVSVEAGCEDSLRVHFAFPLRAKPWPMVGVLGVSVPALLVSIPRGTPSRRKLRRRWVPYHT